MNQQKGFVNIILIVLVVVLAGAVVYFALVKKSPEVTQQTNTPAPINNQQNNQTSSIEYRNMQYGFSFTLPVSWKGYSIITTHFCVRGGEIDIIAHKSKNLTFIEVKTRSIQSKGKPYEAFTKTKFIRIKRTIHSFLSQYTHTYDNFQIDLVCI